MERSKTGAAAQPKKQLTLKNWFEKPSNASSKVGKNSAASTSQFASKSRPEPKTPESKRIDVLEHTSSAAKSPISSEADYNAADTPPTSDAIDVDMLSAEELEEGTRGKRVSVCPPFELYLVHGFQKTKNGAQGSVMRPAMFLLT